MSYHESYRKIIRIFESNKHDLALLAKELKNNLPNELDVEITGKNELYITILDGGSMGLWRRCANHNI